MIIQPVSFNGTSILTGTSTDYDTKIPRASALMQQQTNAMYVKRAGATPVYSGKDFQPHTIVLEIIAIHDFMSTFESLNQLFDTGDETPRQLIVQDTEDSNKQYYVYATTTQVQGGHDGPMATVALAADDPIWQSVTLNSQTFSTTTTTGTTDVIVNGNAESYPIFEITPATQPSTDYLYSTYIQVLPTSNIWSGAARFLDLTGSSDTTFDTAALVAGGKMQADGDDLRVFRDGVEIDRWLDGINTTDTHVIIATDLRNAVNMTLKTAFVSTDTVTEIEITDTTANRNLINQLPNQGRLIVDASLGSTDSEEFTYTSRTITATKLAFTINSRSVRNTSAFDHAAGANVRYLQYDFTIVYGSATATAPTVDNTRKPIQSLTSRNSSYIFTNFVDAARLRPNVWTPGSTRRSISTQEPRSHYYTSTNDAGDTDPATAMGLAAQTFENSGFWRSDTIFSAWSGYFLDGISSVSASGDQFQNSASWPTLSLQANNPSVIVNGRATYTTLWTITAQASTDYGTWTTWTKASSDAVIPTDATELRWVQEGTILGSTDYAAKGEISSITVGIANPPNIQIRPESNNNKLDFTLTNATTGESMRVIYPIGIANTLTIDTDPEFPTAKANGQVVNGTVFLSSTRSKWLRMTPGTNTINFDSNLAAASDISIVIKWRDRMNFY